VLPGLKTSKFIADNRDIGAENIYIADTHWPSHGLVALTTITQVEHSRTYRSGRRLSRDAR